MVTNKQLIEKYINHYQHSPDSQNMRKSSLNYFFGSEYFGYGNFYIPSELSLNVVYLIDPIFEITTSLLKEYFVWLKNLPGLSVITKQNKWITLTSFLNFTMEDYEEFLIKIPSKSVNWRGTNGNGKQKKEIATMEEIEQLLQYFKVNNFKHYIIFRLLVESGMRKGEVINAMYSYLNIEERYIRSKGKTEDVAYYFSKELAKYLQQYLQERKKLKVGTKILFLNKFREKYSSRAFNLLLKRACNELGITKNITCHTFRRTLNTYRKKLGVSNEDRKILLNHKVRDVNIQNYIVLEREEYLNLFDSSNPYIEINL